MKKSRKPVHPGEVFLQDVLIPLGITRKALSEFVNQKSSCSPSMAIRIANVTRTSAESWLTMQTKLDLWKERQKRTLVLQEFPKIAV